MNVSGLETEVTNWCPVPIMRADNAILTTAVVSKGSRFKTGAIFLQQFQVPLVL